MADEMKTLSIEAENGSFIFDLIDETAREAAQAAKKAAESIQVPTALPNPFKLIFTGGATGEYDGSGELTIAIPSGGGESCGGDTLIQYVESLDSSNLANLRDLDSGTYILYGYFKPYPGAPENITMDNVLAGVVHLNAGSHIMVYTPLNFKLDCYEILVDSSVERGFTYTRTVANILDLVKMQTSQVQTITAESTHDQIPTAKAVYDLFSSLTVADEVAY